MFYPDNPSQNDIENHSKLLNLLPYVLPCTECSTHFRNNINNYNLSEELKSKQKYIKLIYNLHNDANKLTNKSLYNYDTFIKQYQDIMNSSSFNPIYLYNLNNK